jgi:predicted permease
MGTFFSDLKFVLRSLSQSPLFVVVALLSLALGIGANSAIFSLMDQVLLRSLPVKDPKQLVWMDWDGTFQGRMMNDHAFSYPMYQAFRDKNPGIFTGVASRFVTTVDVQKDKGTPNRARAELVSGNFFEVLGVGSAMGRLLEPKDDLVKDAAPYVVLSYGMWMSRFGGNSNILNQTILVNGHPMTVVGVAQKGFKGFEVGVNSELFIPMMMKRQVTPLWDDLDNKRSVWLNTFARLRPNVSSKQALAALTVVYRQQLTQELTEMPDASPRFRQRYPQNTLKLMAAASGMSGLREQFSTPLIVLMCMVGTLLLIACGNIANLLVARAVARQKEISIRLSLGASHAAIIRLVLLESLLLSVAGGLLGLVVSSWTGALLLRALPFEDTNQLFTSGPDLRVLVFTLGLSILTAVVFGLLPAFQATHPDMFTTLKNEAGNVSASGGQLRLRKILVTAQISLSLLLLIGAGLFARSLYNLMSLNPGVQTERMLTFSVDPTLSGYSATRIHTLYRELLADLSKVPGVMAVSASEGSILSGNQSMNTTQAEGFEGKEGENLNPQTNSTLPGFFTTLGIPLVSGRDFADRDDVGAPKVAVVNESFVSFYFKGRNPLGRHIGYGGPKNPLDMEIVGVVKDAKLTDLKEKPTRYVFTPALQDKDPGGITFFIRTTGDAASFGAMAHQVVSRADATLPVFDVKTLHEQANETHYIDRMISFLSAAFGLLATLLAAIGLYGVMSYTVARRTKEIGIRIALGAPAKNVLWSVMREVLLLSAIGILVAIPIALGLGRYIQSQLYGLQALDPMTITVCVALLASVSSLAGWIPAYRATRVDPITALRYE